MDKQNINNPNINLASTKAEEVQKMQDKRNLDHVSSHDETEDERETVPKAGLRESNYDSAENINKQVGPEDNEVYKSSDNAEAKDANRVYEDVITPETYQTDGPLSDEMKKNPKDQ